MASFTDRNRTVRRRELRTQRPAAERILWTKVNGRQLEGFKIRRQHSIGSYVVDFYCAEVKVAIELDGMSHDDEASEVWDQTRDTYIRSLGVLTIRFLNQEVMESADTVAEKIAVVLLARRSRQDGHEEIGADLP